MPMFDAYLKYCDALDFTSQGVGTLIGTNEIDFEETVLPDGVTTLDYPDKGSGSPLVVRFMCTTSFTSANSTATVAFALCFDTATKAGGTSAGTIVVQTAPILVTALTAGAYIPELKIPDQHARFSNVNFVVAVQTITAGAITAYIDVVTGMRHR